MNCSPTLTAEDFKTIHNAICGLDSLVYELDNVVNPVLVTKLTGAINDIRKGLADAYDQDDKAFSRKSRHFDAVKVELGLKNSEWSIYEVDNMSDHHPYAGATVLVYKDHWGDKPVSVAVNGLTWAALWFAADAAVRDSGDQHHVFIESFRQSKENPEVLYLSTGS